MKYTLPAIAVLVVAADRLLKWYAQSLPDQGTAFSLVPGVAFGHYTNPALFFFPAWRWIPWAALFVLVLVGTLLISLRHPERSEGSRAMQESRDSSVTPLPQNDTRVALLFLLLGGLSNVYDRFAYHGVIDYLTFLHIATWNLADILIGIGILLFFLNHKTASK